MQIPPEQTAAVSPAAAASVREAEMRIADLMRRAAALSAQKDVKALQLYNEVLSAAPRYAEAYRQRALLLERLGNRAQAHLDYRRFLELNPQVQSRIEEEIRLYENVRRPPGTNGGISGNSAISFRSGRAESSVLADGYYALAVDALKHADYSEALRMTRYAHDIVPSAKVHAARAQAFFARGNYRAAATEARAAVAMGPLLDWPTLYAYYSHDVILFTNQLKTLEEYVRQYPASADGHFLLGYQYLVLGRKEAGQDQLATALTLQPTDLVAKAILTKQGVEVTPVAAAALPGANAPAVASVQPPELTPPAAAGSTARQPGPTGVLR